MKIGQSSSAVKVSNLALGDYVKYWTSSNTSVAKVDKRGKITAQKRTGRAVITVVLASGKKASLTVSVGKNNIRTTRITGIPAGITLRKNRNVTLRPVLLPLTSQDRILYATSDKRIATVTSRGVVTAKKARTVRITVMSGRSRATVKIVIPKTTTTSLRNVPAGKTLKRGTGFRISAAAVPSDSDEPITYRTSNSKVASVDSRGNVTARMRGTVRITVKSGKVVKIVTVTVK